MLGQVIDYNEYKGPVSIATKDGVIFVDHHRRLCKETGPSMFQKYSILQTSPRLLTELMFGVGVPKPRHE